MIVDYDIINFLVISTKSTWQLATLSFSSIKEYADTTKNVLKKLRREDEKREGHFIKPIFLAKGRGEFPIRNRKLQNDQKRVSVLKNS